MNHILQQSYFWKAHELMNIKDFSHLEYCWKLTKVKFLPGIFVWFFNVFVELNISDVINLVPYDKWLLHDWCLAAGSVTCGNNIEAWQNRAWDFYDHEYEVAEENLISSCNQSRMLCKFTSWELNKHVPVCGWVRKWARERRRTVGENQSELCWHQKIQIGLLTNSRIPFTFLYNVNGL